MNIQQASDVLAKETSKEHLSYFTKQLVQFKYEPTTPLKDFLEFINENTIQWLQKLPKTAKSRNTLSKYRTSITTLLGKEQIREDIGSQYCIILERKINDTFKNNVDNIVDERDGTSDSTIDNDNFIDINTIESVNNTDHIVDVDEQKIQFDKLTRKYNDLCIKFENLQELYNKIHEEYKEKLIETKYLTKESEFLRELLRNLTTK